MALAQPILHSHTDLTRDLYGSLRQIREQDPIHWFPAWECWLVTRHDDALDVLRDSERFSQEGRSGFDDERGRSAPPGEVWARNLTNADPPDHTRLRAALSRRFTPAAISTLRERITTYIGALLDSLDTSEPVDVISQIALRVPAFVVPTTLGFQPEILPPEFLADATSFVDLVGIPSRSPHAQELMVQLGLGVLTEEVNKPATDFAQVLFADPARYLEPDSIFAELSDVHARGELSYDETISFASLMVIAAFDTTKGLLTNTMALLASNPEQLQRLCEDRSLVPLAIEECLRFEAPVTRIPRRVVEDMTYRGRNLARGDIVMVMVSGANRDPERYVDPDRFDVGRFADHRVDHLGFSTGRHICLAAHLARLQANVLVEQMLERYRDIELTKEFNWMASYEFRTVGPELMLHLAKGTTD